MSCYDDLPTNFHDCWVQNLAYCLWHYTSLIKHFVKSGNDIIMYEITTRNGKYIFTTTVKYNITTQNFDVSGERLVTTQDEQSCKIEKYEERFVHYQNVLDYLWGLDTIKTFEDEYEEIE